MSGKPLVVIGAGGTGGHMFPAAAFAEEMASRGWEVGLISDDRGLRYADKFPASWKQEVKAASPNIRKPWTLPGTALKLRAGVNGAVRRFKQDQKPALVAGFGGYPAYPALSAGRRLKIPLLIHEQNAVLGRVNRVFAKHAAVVASGFERLDRLPRGANHQPVGNPVRASIAAMRDAAVDEVVVIGDADTIPEREPLLAAIRAAATSNLVHLPYDEYRWLGRTGSADHAAGTALEHCTFEQLVDGACSGIYVATPRTWAAHGGQDEGFRGWGFEDAAWYLAHTTLLGAPPRRHRGRVYALHHVGEARSGAAYDANAARMERYRDAAGDPERMAALVFGYEDLDAAVLAELDGEPGTVPDAGS